MTEQPRWHDRDPRPPYGGEPGSDRRSARRAHGSAPQRRDAWSPPPSPAPGSFGPDGRQPRRDGGSAQPDPGLYQPGPYRPDPYRPDPYRPGPYRPDPYRPDPYRPDPYRPDPYRPDPYRPDPYRPDPYRQPGPGQPHVPAERDEPSGRAVIRTALTPAGVVPASVRSAAGSRGAPGQVRWRPAAGNPAHRNRAGATQDRVSRAGPTGTAGTSGTTGPSAWQPTGTAVNQAGPERAAVSRASRVRSRATSARPGRIAVSRTSWRQAGATRARQGHAPPSRPGTTCGSWHRTWMSRPRPRSPPTAAGSPRGGSGRPCNRRPGRRGAGAGCPAGTGR